LILVLLVTPALVVGPALVAETVALAQDDDEEDDDFDDEDEDEDEDEEEDEEEGDGEPQPAVTAGGMFTKKSYPVAELERPLTLIKGMFEVRGGIDIDVSDQTAFEIFRFKADARYGLADHVELQAISDFLLSGDRVQGTSLGLVGFGLEGALYYDMVHFRSVAALTFSAADGDLTDADPTADETDTGFDLILGMPFRYRIKPEIALIALDEIMTVHFAGGKPDLTVGIGGVFQVIPQAALIARAELFVPQFDTQQLTVPLTAAAQFSPNNQFDLGLEFTLPVDVRDEENRFSQRSVLLFVQARL
jgi:hypothetical protein